MKSTFDVAEDFSYLPPVKSFFDASYRKIFLICYPLNKFFLKEIEINERSNINL